MLVWTGTDLVEKNLIFVILNSPRDAPEGHACLVVIRPTVKLFQRYDQLLTGEK